MKKRNQLTIDLHNKSKDKSSIGKRTIVDTQTQNQKALTKPNKKSLILKSSPYKGSNSNDKASKKKLGALFINNHLPLIHSPSIKNTQAVVSLSKTSVNQNKVKFSQGFLERNLRQIKSKKDINSMTNSDIFLYYSKKRNDIPTENNTTNSNTSDNTSNTIYSPSLLKAISSNKLSLLSSNSIKTLTKNKQSNPPRKCNLVISPWQSKHNSIHNSPKAKDNNYNSHPSTVQSKKNLNVVISQTGKSNKNEHHIKTNQDSYLIIENPFNMSNFHIYGIMDGHGFNGHFVSQYIANRATKYFLSKSTYHSPNNKTKKTVIKGSTMTDTIIYNKLKGREYEVITEFYGLTNRELLNNEQFDISYSGSTCLMIFHIGNKLICANTGDSRGILVKEIDNKSTARTSRNNHHTTYNVIPLSIDHKPNIPSERKRIELSGGIVDQSEEKGRKYGPYRVWVQGEPYPGLAISRTIGDEVAEGLGVIYNPDIITMKLTAADKYIILASDGLWDVLTNEEVMNIITPFYTQGDLENGCKVLINEATSLWKKNHVDIDDITVIIATLQGIDSVLNTIDSADIMSTM